MLVADKHARRQMQRWALLIGLLGLLLSVVPATATPLRRAAALQAPTPTPAPTGTATPTPSPSPTRIPTVELAFSGIITTTRQLATDQVSAWNPSADTAPLFLGLAALILVFGLLMLLKALVSWRVRAADE